MNGFTPGDNVYAGNTLAVFVKYVGPSSSQAIIKVGLDTRVVDPVSLRKA